MTQQELDALPKTDIDPKNTMKPGRVYNKHYNLSNMYCVRMTDSTGKEFVGAFTIDQWIAYFKRAVAHGNSCTKKNLITDLFD